LFVWFIGSFFLPEKRQQRYMVVLAVPRYETPMFLSNVDSEMREREGTEASPGKSFARKSHDRSSGTKHLANPA